MTVPRTHRIFARVARLVPRAFRSEYGVDMLATFARRNAAARERGPARHLWFVTRELLGLARVALSERVAGPAGMRVTTYTDAEALNPMEHLLRDVRHAARRLRRTRGFAAAALFTLALAIGANTAIFALLHRVVLQPLPYPAAERLIALDHAAPGVGLPSGLGLSEGLYREYAAMPSVEAVAMYFTGEATLSGRGDAERIETLVTTPSLGGVLGDEAGARTLAVGRRRPA